MAHAPLYCRHPQGILPYFKETAAEGTTAGWFGHSFGACLTGLAYGAFADPDSKTVCKMMAVASIAVVPNIIAAITDKSGTFDVAAPGVGINIWQLQIVPHLAVCGLLASAGFGGSDKDKAK